MGNEVERRYWLARGFEHQTGIYRVLEWVADGYCAMDWREAPEIPVGLSPEAARDLVRAEQPGWSESKVYRVTRAVQSFVDRMSEGDVVVAAKAPYDVHVGVVAGPAYYVETRDRAFARRRAVNWLTVEGDEPYPGLPEEVRAHLKARPTLTLLPAGAAAYFGRYADAAPAAPTPAPAQDPYRRLCRAIKADEAATRLRTVERPATVERYRDPRAVEAVLERCGGRCENPDCGGMPQDTTVRGEPLLEVDHIDDHASGGRDHPKRMIALCPNCHAMKTRGARAEVLRERFRKVARKAHKRRLAGEG
ncbi:HNH endonuclease [Streptomyces sp. NPDC006512]|uniref:HNH endonuclease n=1 Tax=Streptomyces sp. NPDC006512 TaxID=3154307 RepID=UPI0033B23D1E